MGQGGNSRHRPNVSSKKAFGDARLVKLVSHPVFQEELKKFIQKAETLEGKLDKKGNKKKKFPKMLKLENLLVLQSSRFLNQDF